MRVPSWSRWAGRSPLRRFSALAGGLLIFGLLAMALLLPFPPLGGAPASAAPVSWKEVPATEAGRQWWDEGSLRISRDGWLSVLSRYQPAPAEQGDTAAARPKPGQLYVMDLDCGLGLYRDTSVNGLPRFGAEWQPTGGDPLISAVLEEACAAGAPLLASR